MEMFLRDTQEKLAEIKDLVDCCFFVTTNNEYKLSTYNDSIETLYRIIKEKILELETMAQIELQR